MRRDQRSHPLPLSFRRLPPSLNLSTSRPRPLSFKKKKPSAKRFLPGYKPQRGVATRQSRLSNWKESAWKLFVYSALTFLAAASTFPSGFFLHTPDFWEGCTKFPPCNYAIARPMGLVYALELGEFSGFFFLARVGFFFFLARVGFFSRISKQRSKKTKSPLLSLKKK